MIICLTFVRHVQPVSNNLDPDQAEHFILPDLGPNCLKSRLRWYMFTPYLQTWVKTEEDLKIGKKHAEM